MSYLKVRGTKKYQVSSKMNFTLFLILSLFSKSSRAGRLYEPGFDFLFFIDKQRWLFVGIFHQTKKSRSPAYPEKILNPGDKNPEIKINPENKKISDHGNKNPNTKKIPNPWDWPKILGIFRNKTFDSGLFRDFQIPILIPGISRISGFFDRAKNKKKTSRSQRWLMRFCFIFIIKPKIRLPLA